MAERTFHPLDYVSLLRRRKWWMVVPIVLSIAVGVALALLLPRVYRSFATIAVSSPRVSTDLVARQSQSEREERVRAMSQQLLSRAVLEQVAHAEELDRDRPLSQAVDEMLQPGRIKVEPVALLKQSGSDRTPLDAFNLSYATDSPAVAQKVTNTLASVFVEVNSRAREARAEDTSAFISNQLTESKARLDTLEGKLREAKESYMGRLPEQMQANLSMASGLRQQAESTATALRGEQDRLSMIERQIDAMRDGAADDSGVPHAAQLSNAQQRVVQLQRELAAARAMYTEKHPEIQRLQEELSNAQKQAEADRDRPEQDRLAALQLDPGYRQLVKDRERSRLRVADLERAEKRIRDQLEMYERRIESAPMVEQQLVSLQRDYDLERHQYTSLSGKLQASELAESLERGRGGEQFKVLYAASRPRNPESPNVLRIVAMSVVLGLFLGVGSAIGREYLDRSIHDVRGLQAEFDVPVLGEITRISPHARGAIQ
jgi:polysaccharide chain length determinant protein (PEP-CTERM system associated)